MMMQISMNQEDLRAIKIVETSNIHDEKEIMIISVLISDDDDIQFFWKSDKDPFNNNEEPEWSPYDLQYQKVLKDLYEKYLGDISHKKSEFNIAHLKSPADHYVDFSLMYQINKFD